MSSVETALAGGGADDPERRRAALPRQAVELVHDWTVRRVRNLPVFERRVVKTSRWLLLRNRENVPVGQAVRLDELLVANKALLTVYLLKDDLKQLLRYKSEAWARKTWRSWKRRALCSGLTSTTVSPIFEQHSGLEPIRRRLVVKKR